MEEDDFYLQEKQYTRNFCYGFKMFQMEIMQFRCNPHELDWLCCLRDKDGPVEDERIKVDQLTQWLFAVLKENEDLKKQLRQEVGK